MTRWSIAAEPASRPLIQTSPGATSGSEGGKVRFGAAPQGLPPLGILTDLLSRLAAGDPLGATAAGVAEAALSVPRVIGVAVYVGELERPIAARGATDAAAAGAARLELPVLANGETVGRLDIAVEATNVSKEDLGFLASIAAIAGAAIERARAEAAAARVRDGERARLARELHDGAAQAIGAMKLEVERLSVKHGDVPFQPLLDRLQGVFADLRALSRALRPPALDALGLSGALRALAADLSRRAEVRASYHEEGAPPASAGLTPEAEAQLFRIAEEAVANVARHARARTARIELAYGPRGVKLAVEDDGRGYAVAPSGARGAGSAGIGLLTMQERAAALGAILNATSRPGSGTRVEVAAPYSSSKGPNP